MDIKEAVSKGQIHTRAIIELVGRPKDYIESALKEYVEDIEKNPEIKVIKKEYADIVKNEELFSTYAEIEFLAKNIPALIRFCFNYMPASIEIFEPSKLLFTNRDISDLLNDLQIKLHNLDMTIKQAKFDMKFLSRNMTGMFRNLVTIALSAGSKTVEELSRLTGTEKKDLEEFISELKKTGYLEEKEGKIQVKSAFSQENTGSERASCE